MYLVLYRPSFLHIFLGCVTGEKLSKIFIFILKLNIQNKSFEKFGPNNFQIIIIHTGTCLQLFDIGDVVLILSRQIQENNFCKQIDKFRNNENNFKSHGVIPSCFFDARY